MGLWDYYQFEVLIPVNHRMAEDWERSQGIGKEQGKNKGKEQRIQRQWGPLRGGNGLRKSNLKEVDVENEAERRKETKERL